MDELIERYVLYMDSHSYANAGSVRELMQELVRMTFETADVMEHMDLDDDVVVIETMMDIVAKLRATKGRFDLAFPPEPEFRVE
jgi:hypothetical protein